MSMTIGFNRSNVRRIELKNADGTVAGSITITSPEKKKKMRLQYNFKEISTKLLRTKTSGNARQVMTNARQRVAQLRRMSKSDNYDEDELQSAILHAEAMARVAKKRMKHLQEEERAGKTGGICEAEMEERTEEGAAEQTEKEVYAQKQAEEASQEMEKLMQEYQELMREFSENSMDEFSGELLEMSTGEEIDPDDLEQMKKKHRASEMRDIVEADMKYLKAMFNRLQREKQSAASSVGSAASGSAATGSVSLELGGVDIPVQAPAPDAAAVVEGGAIDTTV